VNTLARQASEKLKEIPGKGGGDARPNPELSHNLDLGSLKPLPEKREVGSGVKKPDNLSPQGAERPIFERPLITEAERLANERWRAINKKMERYTQEQENRIGDAWFDRVTAWFKSQGFTSQDFKPENFTPEGNWCSQLRRQRCLRNVWRWWIEA
jgi:hypothetical protein